MKGGLGSQPRYSMTPYYKLKDGKQMIKNDFIIRNRFKFDLIPTKNIEL